MSDELQKQLALLKTNYLTALPSKIEDLENIWLEAINSGNEEHAMEMHRKAHSLAGSGATFDQERLSKIAKILENFIKDHMALNDLFDESNINKINIIVKKLRDSYGKGQTNQEHETTLNEEKFESDVEQKVIPTAMDRETSEIPTGIIVESMKILIADDDLDNRKQLELILLDSGHEVYLASNGKEAVEQSVLRRPDLILMDVIMPIMTGYDAARQIKKQISDKFVPILFLTAVTDNESLVGCISSGGDDFINKPVHPLILNAKLAAFQRISKMYEKLDEYQRKTEEEMEASKEVMNSVIYSNDKNIEGLKDWAKSPGHFSGDTRMYTQMEDGRIYVLLCDFTGHGLPAAIGTVFVSDLFRSMTAKNIPAVEILNEINAKMNQVLPTGRYCAAIMMDYCPNEKYFKLWNCGLPDAYVTDFNHKIIAKYPSESVPLGVLPGKSNPTAYEIAVDGVNEIIIFSDGITEAENPKGEMFGDDDLIKLIESTQPEDDLFDGIKTKLEVFMDGEEPIDDISLIVYKF